MNTKTPPEVGRGGDLFDLTVFVAVQEPVYGGAFSKLQSSRKRSPWM